MDGGWLRLTFDEVAVETVQRWPGVDWKKRPPRMLRDLSSGPFGPAAVQAGRQPQPRRLDRLRDVHLPWSNFFIALLHRRGPLRVDLRRSADGRIRHRGLAGTVGHRGHPSPWRRFRRLSIPAAKRRAHQRQNHARVVGRAAQLGGMWLLYTLPAVVHFAENRHAYDRLLVFANHSNMQAMLWLLGLKADDVILHDCSRAYHLESIDVFRQSRRDFFVAKETRALFAKLREKVAGGVTMPSARPIYVGRRWTAERGGYRALINECELENRLAAMGYSPISPECLGPKAQIELFGSERRIVVLGGAGLFNAVFCRPGTKIVDIESTRDHLENHSAILSSMDADYGIILGQADQSDPAPHNKRWTVDVERAAAAIAEFMG